jgi:DNA-binding NtrC family response regulator
MSKRVMIVDDQSLVGDVLGQMLRLLGHQPEVFCSADTCLDWLKQDRPDMAFLDLQMPGTDGVSLLGAIRACGHHFPVVAITGYASEDLVRRAKANGAAAVVSKPISLNTLEGLVQLA